MKKILFPVLLFLHGLLMGQANISVPNKTQLAWHEMEMYFLVNIRTTEFTGTGPDCQQWARIARSSGAKGIIISANLDKFCFWPGKFCRQTVKESSWKDGNGDVLKDLSRACRENGIKFGVQLSPPGQGQEIYFNMVKEIVQNYGPVWELRLNGFDWRRYENTIKRLSPRTMVSTDQNTDIRWAADENGAAGKTNWNFTDTGNYSGKWIPLECMTGIKKPAELFDAYLKSVGRGANLVLGISPDDNGKISEQDSASLAGFRELREKNFGDNLLKNAMTYYQFTRSDLSAPGLEVRRFDSTNAGYSINLQNFIVELPRPEKLNCIVFREAIHLGQTIKRFHIVLYNGKKEVGRVEGTTIGRKRILTFETKTITSFNVYIEDARGFDNVSGVAAYLVDDQLIEK